MSDGGRIVRCGHCSRRVRHSKTADCGRCGAPVGTLAAGCKRCQEKCRRIRHAAGFTIEPPKGRIYYPFIMKGRIGKAL